MVRSVKRSSYAILGNRRLTDEVLNTTMCLVEQTLNNRPTTAVSSNHDDLDALTPTTFCWATVQHRYLRSLRTSISIMASVKPVRKLTRMPSGPGG